MNIGFDAKRIVYNGTGLGNYSRFIVNALSAHYPENEYRLYSPGEGQDRLRKQLTDHPSIHFHYPTSLLGCLSPSLWRSVGIAADLKRDSIDLYHGLSNELPFQLHRSGIPSVVTIHDLIFNRYPHFYKPIDRQIYNYKFRKACREADRVIAISRTTRQDIIETYHIPEEKIDIVYQGCDVSFAQAVTEEKKAAVRAAYRLPSHFILCVGSIEERKNLWLVVQAMKRIKNDIHLVAIGKSTPYCESVQAYIKEEGLTERVQILHNIPFGDLPAFYQMAALFVYPSFFEGFGIPIIEALHSEVPVIAATGSCLEEAGGPGSLYRSPRDVDGWAEQIDWVLSTPAQAETMRKAGKVYAQRFMDKQVAADLMDVYAKVLNG